MIEPLKNMQEYVSRDEAEAARLLRSLGPADPLPAVEQRVFARLGKPPRLGPRLLRVASVGAVSLVSTGILAMTAGMVLHRGAETPAVSPTPLPTPPAAVVAAPAAVAEPAPVVVPEPPAPARAEARTVPRPAAPRTSFAERHHAQVPADPANAVAPAASSPPVVEPADSTEAHVAAAPPEEAALVLAGLRALRRQHDPGQAGVLLARYLSRFPQGALVQEALAISIEAGLARGDRKLAAQLAGQYLDRFPAGRFVRLARKAADSTGP